MTLRYFIDSNIILDALLHRGTEAMEAATLIDLGFKRRVELLVTPMSLGTVLYVLQKSRNARRPGDKLNAITASFHALLACVEVIPVSKGNFSQSLNSTFWDLEDGAQYAAAMSAGRLSAIVSRDTDYKGRTAVPLYTTRQALDHLARLSKSRSPRK